MNAKNKFFHTPEFMLLVLFGIFGIIISVMGFNHKAEIKAKDEVIYQLRSKFNNYLLVTGAYDRKASETLPLLKSLGIVEFYYD